MAIPLQSKRKLPIPTPPATRLLLIRHGEVHVDYHNKFGGAIDMDLSPNGKKQAKVLANYLRGKTIDAIYASPMKRVQQTLAPTLKQGKLKQTIYPGLREIDFGDWSGLGWKDVEERFGFRSHRWLHQIQKHGVPNGESGKVFRQRVEPCLREIIAKHPGENVAIFCHGGVIRMMLAVLLKLSLPKTNHFDIEYASITQVALHQHMNEIELLNFTPWRDLVG
ncbi:MAG TPA: histidine phosphatase family protein [Verrucomicrobiae bacterium]|nr:histidine phosphatase family protein [Verrucomicrobiae bacterium]